MKEKMRTNHFYFLAMQYRKMFLNIVMMFIALFVATSNLFGQKYILQTKKLPPPVFGALDFFNDKYGFVLGDNALPADDRNNYVGRTTDGGKSWTEYLRGDNDQGSNYYGMPIRIAMFSPKNIVTNGYYGIKSSEDSGKTWTYRTSQGLTQAGAIPNSVAVARGGANAVYGGFITAGIGTNKVKVNFVLYSTDFGVTWDTSRTTSTKGVFLGVSMGSQQNAVACADDTTGINPFLYSTDGGQTWVNSLFDQSLVAGTTGPVVVITSKGKVIQMANSQIAYAAMSKPSGAIAWSKDGGANWLRRDNNAGLPRAVSLSFLNAKTGVLLTENNDLRITTDSCKTWKVIPSLPYYFSNWRDVQCVTDSIIVVVGTNKGTILRTSDQGKTWWSVNGTDMLVDLVMNASGYGIASGNNWIGRTTNKGADWQQVYLPSAPKVFGSVAYASDSVIIVADIIGGYARSTDVGVNWGEHSFGFWSSEYVTKMNFLSGTGIGVGVSSSGKCVITKDYGSTWTNPLAVSMNALHDVIIRQYDSVYIYACGDSNKVFYSVDTGTTWTAITDSLPKTAPDANHMRLWTIDMISPTSIATVAYNGANEYIFLYDRTTNSWAQKQGQLPFSNYQIKWLSPSAISIVNGPDFRVSRDSGNSFKLNHISNHTAALNLFSVGDMYYLNTTPSSTNSITNTGFEIWHRIQGEYDEIAHSMDFGSVVATPNPQTKTKSIPITNIGADTLTISTVSLAGGISSMFKVETNTPKKINPGVADSLVISFTPNTPDVFSDTLVIQSNAFSYQKDTVVLSGQGVSEDIGMRIETSCVSFDTIHVDSSSIRVLKIYSIGNSPLTISKIYLEHNNTPPFSILGQTSNIVVAANDSALIRVKFEPTNAGLSVDTIIISCNAALNNSDSICISGVGQKGCLTLTSPSQSPYKVEFGDVKIGALDTSVIRFLSSCNEAITVLSIKKEGDIAFTKLKYPANNSNYAPGAGDSIVVEFAPSTVSYSDGTITIKTVNGEDTVFLHGHGVKEVDVREINEKMSFSLDQNYPNPFTRMTIVHYILAAGVKEDVLELRDILGRIMFSKKITNDQSEIVIDDLKLEQGIYFYQLHNHPKMIRRMMVLN